MKSKNLPELLAPAGTPEAMIAAVESGADAVYFGGTVFNARMNAANFDRDSIVRAVNYCHKNNVKAYVTLNTQIYDREINTALEYAEFLWEAGVDALITADIGLSALIKKNLPDFPIHASTQMSAHNTDGADILYNRGFSRVVLARELSRENINAVTEKCKAETEVFVHGAICVSCSGQCLMSAMLGGRSGNRGECAQPCRMTYNGAHPISLKDMCLANHIPELIESGVASLKLEGRMKSPTYVGGVTEIYRRLLDGKRAATPDEISKLERLFSRDGFTDGYYTSQIGGKMLGVRSERDIQNTRSAEKTAKAVSFPELSECVTREKIAVAPVPKPERKSSAKPILTARFRSPSQIPKDNPFEHIYLPVSVWTPVADGVMLPVVIFDSEKKSVEEKLARAVNNGAKHILIRNISHIAYAEKYGLIPHIDFRMNVFNSESARELNGMASAESVILSAELTLPQIRDINCGNARKGVIAYGRIPLMYLQKKVGTEKLRDTRNTVFPIMSEDGRDILLNSVPVYMADQPDRLDAAGVEERHFIFTTESLGEVMKVIYAYKNKTIPKEPMRRIK